MFSYNYLPMEGLTARVAKTTIGELTCATIRRVNIRKLANRCLSVHLGSAQAKIENSGEFFSPYHD